MGSYGDLWRARLEMMRPGNGVMVIVAVWLGTALTRGHELNWLYDMGSAFTGAGDAAVWIAAPVAAFLVNSFGNVLNDVVDRHIDETAHPKRPLPSKRVGPGDAQAFAVLLLGLGLVEAWIAGGWVLFAFAAATAALLGLYELRLKRLPLVGNLSVAVLVAAAFAFGAMAGGAPVEAWSRLWWVMGMVALATLARELLKDIEDAGADTGRRTLGQAMPRTAGWLASGAVGVAVGIDAFLVWTQDVWSDAGRAMLATAGLAFIVASGAGCWRAGLGQRMLKVAMLVALVGLALAPIK